MKLEDSSKIIEIDGRGTINSVFFAENGKQVVSGNAEGMLRRWRVDDGHEVDEPILTEAPILAVALSPDGKWLACGLSGSKSNIKVWDAKTHKTVLDIKGHTDSVTCIDICSESTKLATGSKDKRAYVWSIKTGKRLLRLPQDNDVVAVQFSPKGDRIATATLDKSVHIYESENGKQLLVIPCPFYANLSSPLAWSVDGHRLYVASYNLVKVLDTTSASSHGEWFVPGGSAPSCIALSRNQRFIAVVADRSLSFWDTSTHKQIGSVIEHASKVCSMVLSPDDDIIVTGEKNGKTTFRNLRDIIPCMYFVENVRVFSFHSWRVNLIKTTYSSFDSFHLPQLLVLDIDDATLDSWIRGDFLRAKQLLTEQIGHHSDSVHHAHALAHRALLLCRLKRYSQAMDDAKQSIKVQQSVIGHISLAVTRIINGEHDSAIDAFDLSFPEGLSAKDDTLSLIRAILLFECGKHNDAISYVTNSIDIARNKSLHTTVRAQMLLVFGGIKLRNCDYEQAAEMLRLAWNAIPFQKCPHLAAISLIFGWDIDGLAVAIQQHLQQCAKPFEDMGDAALKSNNPEDAIKHYSTALSLKPINPASLFVKRSKARAALKSWADALDDADEAIKADPQSPWGYKRRYEALCAFQRYDKAVDAFNHMFSNFERSPDEVIRYQGQKYISPARSEGAINAIICAVSKTSPFVLIDVRSGRLCDGRERAHTFRSEPQFKELLSSMTLELHEERIERVVKEYFRYVMFSHVWEGEEPSFQLVKSVKSVQKLKSSLQNNKLRKFCEVVRKNGYRWAWSDTCCIDKTDNRLLNQSLMMMYNWYEASAATFAFLADVDSPSAPGGLKDSRWMTRAWTSQELLAPKTIRFYDRDWKPYLGDLLLNHKESPQIMQELADTVGISREIIKVFHPDSLNIQEKLRIVSRRNATVDEDIAYSLIGIFQSDIRPHYGEGGAALGHLLEDIIARSGEVTVLAWTGRSSPYNSCLPATLAVYSSKPITSSSINATEMDERIGVLKSLVSEEDTMFIYNQIKDLPPVRFARRRLQLPCIIFRVKKLGLQSFGNGLENDYRARVPGIGYLSFRTSDRLSVDEPHKYIFVHPWIRNLRDPHHGFGSLSDDDESDSESDSEPRSAQARPLRAVRAATLDDNTRAWRLLARLQQPFRALLLQQQAEGEFRRVASESKIIDQRLDPKIDFIKDIRVEVVDVL